MNYFFLIIVILVSATGLSFGQERTVNGTVISATDSQPVKGASVSIKGQLRGTTTDEQGKFTIATKHRNGVIVVSYVGMQTVEKPITSAGTYQISLASGDSKLEEVIVTALGISREKKALGYAVQNLNGDEIRKTQEVNVVNALQGKSAGVYINNSSGSVGASSRIIIRGNKSIKGNNQPLFVVDGIPIDNSVNENTSQFGDFVDYGNGAADINPADIEEMTILKGANAAALYGSRASNGVVLITTKSGKGKGFTIGIESSFTFSNPLLLPELQNLYGQGGGGRFKYVNGKGGGINDGTDESFGPRLDQPDPATKSGFVEIAQFDGPVDASGNIIPTPWISHPNNVRDFFETGLVNVNNVSMMNGGAWGNMRLSLTNQNQKGMIPNTDQRRNTLSISALSNLTSKLSFEIKGSYIKTKSDNIAGTGYSFTNPMMQTIWTGRQVNWNNLKNYENADGTQRSWNYSFHDNPYWMLHKNLNTLANDRLIGNASLKYKIYDWMEVRARIGTDYYATEREQIKAYYSVNTPEGRYRVQNLVNQETNADILISATRNLARRITLNASVGGNLMSANDRMQSLSINRLVVPDVYAVSNAKEPAIADYNRRAKQIQSVYGFTTLGFGDQFYIDLTARNDWSSTLPKNNNSYFYPSVTGSWIFSETLQTSNGFFSFGKLRMGWAQVGKDTDPFQLDLNYNSAQPYGSNASFSLQDVIPPLELKPEITTSVEIGTELKFFMNKLRLDVTLYKSNSRNQIVNTAVSSTSGFTSQLVNAGNVENKGIEVILGATPMSTQDFSWDITVNWSKNENKVISLYGDLKSLEIYDFNRAIVVAPVGGSYGTIMGTGFKYHENGKPIVNNKGIPIASNVTAIGNINPDWFGGINNTFRYKSLQFNVLFDVRVGGDLFSRTNADGYGAGALASSAVVNAKGVNIREPVASGGGRLFDGVFEDGKPNNIYVDVQSLFWPTANIAEQFIYDVSFVKLREIVLMYIIPQRITKKIHSKGINVSLFGRNLAILHKNIPNVDPEVSYSSAGTDSQGYEFGSAPSARNIGFKLGFTF